MELAIEIVAEDIKDISSRYIHIISTSRCKAISSMKHSCQKKNLLVYLLNVASHRFLTAHATKKLN